MDDIDEVVALFESFCDDFIMPDFVSKQILEIYNRSEFRQNLKTVLAEYAEETRVNTNIYLTKRQQLLTLADWLKHRIERDIRLGDKLGVYKELVMEYIEQFKDCYEYFFEFAERYKDESYYMQLQQMGGNIYLMFFIYFGEMFATIAYEQFLNRYGTVKEDILRPERKYLRHFIILSYAIVDFYLDDPNISDEDKKQHIKRIGGRLSKGQPSGIHAFDDAFANIEHHFPRSEYPMIYEGIWYAFSKECQTMRDTSIRAVFLKGTTLTAYISSTLLPKLRFEDYPRDIIKSQQLIGFLAQISDDTIDIAKDIDEANPSYSSEHYCRKGNADAVMNKTIQAYLTYTMVHTLTMRNVYGFTEEQEYIGRGFLMLTMIFNLYVVQAFPEYFTEEYVVQMDHLCIRDDDDFTGLIRHYLEQI